ncbi:aminopeptidase P family protein [Candidatus Pelagibacter sp.]|nr:aminopeptidase P family protein [Candidatus Pelagibacter sp.]
MIKNRIKLLREKFSKFNIDGYIIPKNDDYFGEYAKTDRLKIISEFSGSAGFAVILKKKSHLFVDGRYTLQAKKQSGKNFHIYEIPKFFPKNVYKKKLTLGINPKLFTKKILNIYFGNNIKFKHIENDLIVNKITREKNKPFFNLTKKITGETHNSKINRLCKILNSKKTKYLFITAPENIAWILNIRGYDNPNSPIPNCRMLLTNRKKIYFFAEQGKAKKIIKSGKLTANQVFHAKNLNEILYQLDHGNIIIDNLSCSIFYEDIIKTKFNIISEIDPTYELKSIKNKTEIQGMIKSHILDGVALTKFIYWMKNDNKKKITEIKAEKKLEKFRSLSKEYIYPSFNTIAGSGPNGAIVHYRATKKSDRAINKQDLFLCDSGGQYKYGTTDVTRTLCFGKQSSSIKNIYTKVLKGHIAVASADLKKYSNGSKIDVLARKSLKESGLDYSHGTGHGVGFFLNVHEGPQAISRFNSVKIREGMILSNEPGFYKEGKYGMRIENLVFVKKINNKIFFENLTLAPLEKELINFKLLNKSEKDYIFFYHLNVYSKLSKYLNESERKWLAKLI